MPISPTYPLLEKLSERKKDIWAELQKGDFDLPLPDWGWGEGSVQVGV